jgi:hypothetical protein
MWALPEFIHSALPAAAAAAKVNYSGNLLLISTVTVSAESPDHGECLIILVISH